VSTERYLTLGRLLEEMSDNEKKEIGAGATHALERCSSSASSDYSTFFRFESGDM